MRRDVRIIDHLHPHRDPAFAHVGAGFQCPLGIVRRRRNAEGNGCFLAGAGQLEVLLARLHRPLGRKLYLHMARSVGYVRFHLQVDASGSAAREHARALGELQSYGRLNDQGPRPLALRAFDISEHHGTAHFYLRGIDVQVKMRAEQRRILRETDVHLVRNSVGFPLFGFA